MLRRVAGWVSGRVPPAFVAPKRTYCEVQAEEELGEEEQAEDEEQAEIIPRGQPTERRKKHQQVTTAVFKRHFVSKFLRQFVAARQKIYPVAEVVHLYERRVKWHKRHREWEENQTFKLLRRKERETRHRDVERKYKEYRDARDNSNLEKWQAFQDLRARANIQALEILKKTEHLWEFYPDEMQDLKYDIRRSHRPYYTRYN